ncbi:hypothetical protein K1W54_07570 [Micromonospora sp. CPCC 205371]|nr:hypothetical protein [Micromonospora sp. CPCC 205371]
MTDRISGPVRLSRPATTRRTDTAALKAAVRDVLSLDDSDTVVIQQLACAEPGCPPVETVVAVLSATEAPRRWTIHKPTADVTGDDIRVTLTQPHTHGEPQ